MTYDFFVASRYRNKEMVEQLIFKLRDKGKTVYSFFEGAAGNDFELKNSDLHPEEFMAKFEGIPEWKNDAYVKRVFDMDMDALKASNVVILVLPAGKSAHIEAGVAYGLGKKLVLIGEQKETESLYLIFDEHYVDMEEFLRGV